MTVTTTVTGEEPRWLKVGEEGWDGLVPGSGCVLEIRTPAAGWQLLEEGIGAVLVTGNDITDLSGVIVAGRCVGAQSDEIHGEMVTRMNRKGHRIHLCGSNPCGYGGSEEMIHVTSARRHSLKDFQVPQDLGKESFNRLWQSSRRRKRPEQSPQEEEDQAQGRRRSRRSERREKERHWRPEEDSRATRTRKETKGKEAEKGRKEEGEETGKGGRQSKPSRSLAGKAQRLQEACSWKRSTRESEKEKEERRRGFTGWACKQCIRRGRWECKHRGRLILCAGGAEDEVRKRDEAYGTASPDIQVTCRVGAGERETSGEDEAIEEEKARGPAAGYSRAAAEPSDFSGGEEVKREVKGKGGQAPLKRTKEKEKGEERKEGEEEEKEKEEERSLREQRRIIELLIKQRQPQEEFEQRRIIGEQRLKPPSTFAKEVKAESRRSVKNAPEACTDADGSGHGCGRGRGRWSRRWGQDDQLLQLDASPISSYQQPRHEGIVPPGNNDRSTTHGEAGGLRRCIGEQVHCHTDGDERRDVEIGPVLGDAPVGFRNSSPSSIVIGSKETCEVGGQEPEARRLQRRKRKLENRRPQQVATRRLEQRQRRKRKERKGKRSWSESMVTATRWLGLRKQSRKLVEQAERGQGQRRERRREEKGSREVKKDGLPTVAGLEARACLVGRLKPGLEELSWVAEVSGSLKMLGLAMAWLIIMVEYEASSSGILTALMAAFG